MDLASDEGGGRRVQGVEERKKLNHGVQEVLKSRKAVRVKVKVGQRERVLHLRYGIRRDHCQLGVI
jgi:L-2-hydroxyglutarate oxidase LhgO